VFENLIVMQGLPETENAANNLHQKALAFVYTEKKKGKKTKAIMYKQKRCKPTANVILRAH